MGAHYTPHRLAKFLADRIVEHIEGTSSGPVRILDPACGDGELLECLLDALHGMGLGPLYACGVEADGLAVTGATQRLSRSKAHEFRIVHGDFLALSGNEGGQFQFWMPEEPDPAFYRAFDVVIANPPYVRTQVLGADESRRLAERYRLHGRVDLYHAFWVAMTEALRHGGMMGIITSNRFLSTQAGAGIRRFLSQEYGIEEVIDLGDTKLFDAAVLPAIFVGRRRVRGRQLEPSRRERFVRVYSFPDTETDGDVRSAPSRSILDVIDHEVSGRVRVADGVFEVTRCRLEIHADAGKVWELTTLEECDWLNRIRTHSSGTFSDIAAVRVGVKTTADEVFIRSNWDVIPEDMHPESELLRPLLTHKDARRWITRPSPHPGVQILYPHEVINGTRRPVDLDRFPRARAYLESHRERLQRRKYVIDSGRRWYEIWVPQDPAAWSEPKIVFPDISPEPRFYMDFRGRIVDGDSYWITVLPNVPPDTLYLLLGLANSRLIARYHDLAFNNRLYSDRRRYITQYVSKYPLPPLSGKPVPQLTMLVREFVTSRKAGMDCQNIEAFEEEVNSLVDEAFGVASGGEL